MKLSLSWIFEHIYADWRTIDIEKLISLFIKTTAEIEGYEKYHLSLDNFSAAHVIAVEKETITLDCIEWKQQYIIPFAEVFIGQTYLIKKEGNRVRLANGADFGSAKEGMLPALFIAPEDFAGSWKKHLATEDYIIYLDNKSINHRPDMWGHRGVAREIAAMLQLPFKPLKNVVTPLPVVTFNNQSEKTKENPFTLRIENPHNCSRIAGLYAQINHTQASPLSLAFQLLKVDARPINAIVDLTNFVMLDIGQPMHAFDAATISSHALVVRDAKNKEQLVLLDGHTVELSPEDIVITDGADPISLAGISGGSKTGVTEQTTSLILESVACNAATIRRSAARLKKRTDSSTRFEKSLDPQQNIIALQRFVFAAQSYGIAINTASTILSVGKEVVAPTITVTHQCLEQMIGASISSEFVINTLHALEFKVMEVNGVYTITIPTFRATKDIAAAHDITEEIVRYLGYDTIPLSLPQRAMKPFDLTAVERTRYIKRQLAFGAQLHELYTYAFFDESFLRTLNYEPGNTLKVQSAVSENWQRLVTSLIPNLCKAVHHELTEHDEVRFFEWARIWPQVEPMVEKQSLAGIIAHRKHEVDFYDGKQIVENLLHSLGIKAQWLKVVMPEDPWYMPYQTAHVLVNDRIIGTAGKAHPKFYEPVALGQAFIFELDASFLLAYKHEDKKVSSFSKYPSVERDISMLVPLTMTVEEIKKLIASANPKISSVILLDFFEKPEWHNQKSLTFRFIITDPEKTLTHQEADAIWDTVSQIIVQTGGAIR